jgi:hypothetical protein
MRCLNCTTVCADSDPFCPTCRRPMQRHHRSGGFRHLGVPKGAVLFMAIGLAVFNVLAPRWFPSHGDGINWQRVYWSGVVGAVCAVIGAGLGMLMSATGNKD